MRSYFKEVGDGFRAALSHGVVKEPSWRSRCNNAFVDWATSQIPPNESVKYQKGYEVSDQNPLTQRYFENTRGRVTYYDEAPSVAYYFEVAKKAVPPGFVGVVKSFQQYFAHVEIATTTVYSESDFWGDPFAIERDLGWIPRWHFRIENYDGSEPAWITAPVVGTVLPGIAHSDLAFSDGLGFPWVSPGAENIHLLIPGGKRLRVIVEVPALESDLNIEVGGAIRGYTIGDYGYQTLLAIRSNW